MLAAMLPVSAIAESYSAARDLRILNKAHQEVEKDLLAVDSEQYKAGKAPEETVAELIGMLESDPRIASVKRDSATTFTYKLHSGLTACMTTTSSTVARKANCPNRAVLNRCFR